MKSALLDRSNSATEATVGSETLVTNEQIAAAEETIESSEDSQPVVKLRWEHHSFFYWLAWQLSCL